MHNHKLLSTYLTAHLDGDEVGLALIGNGLGQQGLPAPWRAVKQHPLGRGHPKLKKLLRVLNRILKKFKKFNIAKLHY